MRTLLCFATPTEKMLLVTKGVPDSHLGNSVRKGVNALPSLASGFPTGMTCLLPCVGCESYEQDEQADCMGTYELTHPDNYM